MKHIEKLKHPMEQEVARAIAEIDEVDRIMGDVLSREIMPYSFITTIGELIKPCREWSKYSYSSRCIMISELNGCIDIINHMIDKYSELDVEVRIIEGKKTGEIKKYKKSDAELLVEVGMVEII